MINKCFGRSKSTNDGLHELTETTIVPKSPFVLRELALFFNTCADLMEKNEFPNHLHFKDQVVDYKGDWCDIIISEKNLWS